MTPALDEKAERALAAIRERATSLRFEVEHICGSKRSRLSVYYRGAGYTGAPRSDEFRLGLAYSEDAAQLHRLRDTLAGGPARG